MSLPTTESDHRLLHQAFFAQVKQDPQHWCIQTPAVNLRYIDFQNYVLLLGQYLTQKGIKRGDVVALHCDKSADLMAGFMALSCLGAQVLQLDKTFPESLLKEFIFEADAHYIITDAGYAVQDQIDSVVIDINAIFKHYQTTNIDDIPSIEQIVCNDINAERPFWLVYSSGTTGRPKGIAISQKAMLFSYKARGYFSDYSSDSIIGANIYLLWEAFRPVLKGGTTVIVPDEVLYDFNALPAFLIDYHINELLLTPSYLQTLLNTARDRFDQMVRQLQVLWLNGEVVTYELYTALQMYCDQIAIYNLYSISECHDVSVYPISAYDRLSLDQPLPAGYLLPDVHAFIFDEYHQLCSSNVQGELYISTPGLAHEYINRDDLNHERFVEEIIDKQKFRLYKTGDYAALDADNLLTIYGRCDYIVKLRGYTISLPFVESVLKETMNLERCHVTKTGDTLTNEKLVAQLEVSKQKQHEFWQKWHLAPGVMFSLDAQNHLATVLAHYMIPSYFIVTETLKPRSYVNRIINQKSDQSTHQTTLSAINHLDSLKDMQVLWSVLLETSSDAIMPEDSFFQLGGTSLKAMVLLNKLNQFTKQKITLQALLLHNTLQKCYELYHRARFGQSADPPMADALSQSLQNTIYQDIDNAVDALNGLNTRLTPFSKRTNILVTGVTGFLGSYILKLLLRQSSAHIYCLLRAKDMASGYQRLDHLLKNMHLDPYEFQGRLQVLVGDLTKDQMGLSTQQWDKIVNTVDQVFHAASDVNLMLPYEALKPGIINGLFNILKLCMSSSPFKSLHYVSTNGVFPDQKTTIHPESLTTEYCLPELASGYAQAKWASEQIIRKATEKWGLTVNIYRPGNIAYNRGALFNFNDFNTMLLKEIQKLKCIPANMVLELTPVDHIARFIVSCAQKCASAAANEYTKHQALIYNLLKPNYLTSTQLQQMTQFPLIDAQRWIEHVTSKHLKPLFDATDKPTALLDARARYANCNYLAKLEQLGIKRPLMTDRYVQLLWIYSQKDH